jgi:Immunity protein Imm1
MSSSASRQPFPWRDNSVILNAYFDHRWHNAEAGGEVDSLISELIATLKHERPSRFVAPGTDALLCLARERFHHKLALTKDVKGHLQVAVNKATGYGALMWYWGGSDPVWVSDNLQPPDFDPRVVSDPGYPLFHDPASTLPIEQFREALEEFCYSGTGERPTAVQWVRSDICGRREDREYIEDYAGETTW